MECEMEVAVVEVEAILEKIEALLLGGYSTGVTNKRKFVEWHIPATVNTPDSDQALHFVRSLFLCIQSLYVSLLSL